MASEEIEKIKEVGLKKLQPAGSAAEKISMEPDKGKFDAALQEQEQFAKQAGAAQADNAVKPSLIEEVAKANHKVEPLTKSSPSELLAQAQGTVTEIERLKETLTTQPSINNAYRNLLHNKLTHIDDNLKIALSKAGVEYTAAEQKSGVVNPIERFLGNLSHAQFQLENLGSYLEGMAGAKEQLSPANMLAIQIKVTHIQQELEFFTSLLNKALESTKTLMNVQV